MDNSRAKVIQEGADLYYMILDVGNSHKHKSLIHIGILTKVFHSDFEYLN